MSNESQNNQKSNTALREEAVLVFWKENDIFKKSLDKEAPNGEFVFYEGPPGANGVPMLHHFEARAFKDVIPRYKTMQGFHVDRRAGWDCHGLPVELQVEKELGLKSKKEIEVYGIAAYNQKCKEAVLRYTHEWEVFTDRIGYWVDNARAYYTMANTFIESGWNIISEAEKRDYLYKDYKVLPWCSRCGTALSSHELGQPGAYQGVKDLSVTAKFKIRPGQELIDSQIKEFAKMDDFLEEGDSIERIRDHVYFLAWTTTPWTLPGNVGLAVNPNIDYRVFMYQADYSDPETAFETYIFADALSEKIIPEITKNETTFRRRREFVTKGSDLVGLEYEPLYPYLGELIKGHHQEKNRENAYKVYAADFVTTTDGTGIVHTAVMYGADDFELGTKVGLPKFHTVNEEGKFIFGTDFLEGRFVKDEEVAIDIIKDLAHRRLLFKKEKYEHSYPHCWRCKTPLIYYARDSWYFAMSKLRSELVERNETINWEPAHIKEGRFGEWLRDAKDWAISRERYWGTPLPIWHNEHDGMHERIVVDSLDTLKKYSKKSGNKYFVMRHAESVHNTNGVWSIKAGSDADLLTETGKVQINDSLTSFTEKIDLIITTPFRRGQETAFLAAAALGIGAENSITDERIGEWNVGSDYDGKNMDEYFNVRNQSDDRYHFKSGDGESYADVFTRTGEFLYEMESKYKGKNILIVTHGGTARAMEFVAKGFAYDTLFQTSRDYRNFANAEIRQIDFVPLPHNENYELDLHRPFIDSVVLEKDGHEFHRVKEVMDVWFDSGAMPFAQDHYPFENKRYVDTVGFPADFISEAIDQTRGWFYTLLAVATLIDKPAPFRNAICLGHLLDKEGKKMSKSIGNVVEPYSQIEKFGADTVRLWMYSVTQPGDSKNYDEKTVGELQRQVFGLLYNVLAFYELYRDTSVENVVSNGKNVLDVWIATRLDQLIALTTEDLDNYRLMNPVREIRAFIEDLSTWYLRRSRDRIKEGDTTAKTTLYCVLKILAQVMAPFAPFAAEDIWQKLKNKNDVESVHLSEWPQVESGKWKVESEMLENMKMVREICTEGNALRKKAGIAVKQPLNKLQVASLKLSSEYLELIKDELNVKEVVVGETTELDTTITSELKAEGNYRELVRAVQDLRKEKGLTPQDTITLMISKSAEDFLTPFLTDFKKTVLASAVNFADNDGSELKIDEITLNVTIEK